MKGQKVVLGQLMDENSSVTFIELCEQFDISEKKLIELLEHGLFEETFDNIKKAEFDFEMIRKINHAISLESDLGLNTQGAVVVLDLIEELQRLQNELNILKRHFSP